MYKQVQDNTELDQLVLSAVNSPTSSPFRPTLESTNFDDLDEEDSDNSSPSHTATATGASVQSDITSYYVTNQKGIPEMEYEAQTLPLVTKQRKNSVEVPVNGGYVVLGETSFEQTQVRDNLVSRPSHVVF